MSAISAVQRPWASFRQEPTERVDARQWDMLPLPTDCLRSASHPSKGEEVSRLRSSLLAIWSKDELSIELLTLVRLTELAWVLTQPSPTCGAWRIPPALPGLPGDIMDSALSKVCNTCHQPTEPGDAFCGSCGTRTTVASVAAPLDEPPPSPVMAVAPTVADHRPTLQGVAGTTSVDGSVVGVSVSNTTGQGLEPEPTHPSSASSDRSDAVGVDPTVWRREDLPAAGAAAAAGDFNALLGVRVSAGLSELRAGDWPGALLGVLGALVAMWLLALGGLLLVGAASLGVGGILRLTVQTVVLSLGGSTRVSDANGGAGYGSFELSVLPLTITLTGFGVMAGVYVQRLATDSRRQALVQAARMTVVLIAAVVVLTLLGSGNVGFGASGSLHLSSNLFASVLFAICSLAAALALAVFVRGTALLGEWAFHLRAQAAGPVCGLLVMGALSLALGLPAVLVYASWQGHPLYGLAAVLLVLPNLSWTAVMLGIGVPVHVAAAGSISLFSSSTTSNLTLSHLLSASPIWWLLPPLALLCLLAGGLVTALRGTDLATARRDCLRLGLALPLVMLIGAWLMGLSGSGQASSAVLSGQGQGSVHAYYPLALILGAVAGLVAGGAGFLLAPKLPTAVVSRLLRLAGPLGLRTRNRRDPKT